MPKASHLPDAALQSKGERTRAKLLSVAAGEFARRGYHNTKVADIVQESGFTQPTFYIYFSSKEAAYTELVGEFRRRLQALTKTLLIAERIPDEQVVDRVALSFKKFLDFLAEDPDLSEIGFFQPPGCTDTKSALASWIASNIVKEQANGLFRADIPAPLIGACFVGMIDQMARKSVSAKGRAEIALHCARILCEGLWLQAAQ